MTTFYIQLQDKLLQISGELTAENISKALGYVPGRSNFSGNFEDLNKTPLLLDDSGELNITDENGNIIAKINSDGIYSVEFINGEHKLSDKVNKDYVDEAVKNVKVDLTGYATEDYVNNVDFYNIKNNPIVNSENGTLTFIDESGYIGLKVTEDGLIVKDVVTPEHTLSNKADKSDIPTKLSDLTNDKGYITVDEIEIPSMDEYVTDEELNQKGFLTEHQDISHLATKDEIPSLDGYATQLWVNQKGFATQSELSNLSFNDIQGSPISEDNSGELNITDENGNVGFKVNEEGVFVKDIIAGNNILSNKQDKLISGTNIKTINNQSILGDGNITINSTNLTIDTSMSDSSTNAVQNKVIKTYIDSNCNIPVETTTSTSKQLTPNKYCKWTNTPTSITITLETPTNSNILNNYMFEFTASSSGTTLTMPSTIKWLNGSTPTIDNDKTYQISIINNLATISKFS